MCSDITKAEHTHSYYAHSFENRPAFPALTGDKTVDVCIVGGGFTGVSTALHLVERGYSVALVEANRIGWGASGRNGGQITGNMGDGTWRVRNSQGDEAYRKVWQMGVDCVEIIRERVEKYQIDCDLKWGHFTAALSDKHLRQLQEYKQQMEANGYQKSLQLVGKDEVSQFVNTGVYLGGLVNMGHGHVHPLKLCVGEAQAAQKLGAHIYEHSPVQRIVRGDKPRVVTEQGSITARHLVMAGNAYMFGLVDKLDGMVIPAPSYVMATEPLGEARARALMPADMGVYDMRIALDYYRLSADKRLLFGGLCNYFGQEAKDIRAALTPNMLKIFPELEGVNVEFAWGGKIGISMNRIPQFGVIDNNIFYAQGYSGHGLAPTHMAGKVLADAIAGERENFDILAKVHHWRLPFGRTLSNLALGAGMSYYLAKEAIFG
ncbi:NAD(P)/FAD-dependent oxidoreductase [Simiduia agarivorans]|uniref:FAD dependent oxidoreductase n=1 Tax=Simiduia agarivorans (strain DSM 21679 / JCM 13881 / BCRC 17597 / SA1) TaxID=1117647 RepID=K4KWV9_SIMAS|nr:FAD-binding oxidoreductase [Simiduia agarivorans]AFU98432.1 FAD dependent oxidoreductase [Simiduia agarivorans SA1 = DSM 21679]